MMATPLPGLVSETELKALFAQRSKTIDEKTVTAISDDALQKKREAEEADGWVVLRTNRRSIRLKKSKPTDRQLEDDIWTLLYRMGFKELNKDRHLNINGRQWDVFAKDDETAIVVECTHSREAGQKSLKNLLDKIEANREELVKAIHTHYGREPKIKVKFAIATKDIEWRGVDKERATKAGIAVITDDDIAYFNRLTSLLKSAARYQFLGRYLRGEKVEGLRTQVSATKGWSGGDSFFNFLISPHDLLRVAYISHKSKSSNNDFGTYQRLVQPNRLKSIANFIDAGGKFPTNIVINFKSDALQFDTKETIGDTTIGTLHLPGLYGSVWVIDGQHRLYGYAHAKRKAEEDKSVVSVLAFVNMDIIDEIKMFVDINSQQVKVRAELVNQIIADLDIDDPDPRKRLSAVAARVALQLDVYKESPINGCINSLTPEKNSRRCLTQTSLAAELAKNHLLGTAPKAKNGGGFINYGPLTDISGVSLPTVDKSVKTISFYLALFANPLATHWELRDQKNGFLCTNVGVRTLILLLRKLVDFVEKFESISFYTLPPEEIVERVAPYVRPVVTFFETADQAEINKFRARGSSLGSLDQNCMQMMCIVNDAYPDFYAKETARYKADQDAEGTNEARELINQINLIIYNDVVAKLKEHYGEARDNWYVKGFPSNVKNECDQRFNDSDGSRERWQFLMLPNYNDIILYGENWELFRNHYCFYGKGKKSDAPRWIKKLATARQITHHAEKGPLPKDDINFVRRVYALVKRFIEQGEELDGKTNYLDQLQQETKSVLEPA